MLKRIAVIGSTGSVGTQVLNVVRRHSKQFKITALIADSNIEALAKQAAEFMPEYVGICNNAAYEKAKHIMPSGIKIIGGEDALTFSCLLKETDIAVITVTGMAGLKPLIAAIENGKRIALSNKESIVAAGKLINDLLKKHKAEIAPVDSEHSAIWQCLKSGRKSDVKRLILTASGGAFYGKSASELKNVTAEQAVKHPTWSMGRKISVDSATMMNKTLEIIEARYLFGITNIDYVIHPESIIHSMVEYKDGAIISQMSLPTMELPIQLALTYPQRMDIGGVSSFNFDSPLTFKQPDETNFPAPKLAYQCLETGGTAPCILNAANEAAVSLFMSGRIGFTDIYSMVEATLAKSEINNKPTFEDIFDCHNNVMERVLKEYK